MADTAPIPCTHSRGRVEESGGRAAPQVVRSVDAARGDGAADASPDAGRRPDRGTGRTRIARRVRPVVQQHLCQPGRCVHARTIRSTQAGARSRIGQGLQGLPAFGHRHFVSGSVRSGPELPGESRVADGRDRLRPLGGHPPAAAVRHRTGRARAGAGARGGRPHDPSGAGRRRGNRPQRPGPGPTRSLLWTRSR